jgi:hypothetical protein
LGPLILSVQQLLSSGAEQPNAGDASDAEIEGRRGDQSKEVLDIIS